MLLPTRPARPVRWRRAGGVIALLVSTAPIAALAQSNSAAPQTQQQSIPGLNDYRFRLPPTPQATPTPEPTIAPLPRPTPTPTSTPAPAVAATPTPRATPSPVATPRATPSPRLTPSPTATPEPQGEATVAPAPLATPTAAPTPLPVASATPAPAATPTAIAVDATVADHGSSWLPWLAGLLVVGAAGGAIVLLRRRATSQIEVAPIAPESISPTPPVRPRAIDPAPAREPAMLDRAPPAPPAPVPAAELTLTLTPRRAGLNLISATAEADLLVRNDGPLPVQGVRVGSALLEAGNGQESAVAGYFTEAVARPAVAPFALQPGEERRIRIVVARARDAIRGVPANGRTMFVPVVAINVLYQANGGNGQAARAFAIGVGRDGGSKLMPFWLDQPSGMFDGLEARSYGPAIVR